MVKNYTKWYFLEPFLEKEEKIHLKEISRRVGKPHTIVRRYLNNFYEKGILKKEQSGRQVYYSLNKDYLLFIDILSIVEKEKLVKKSDNSLILKEFIAEIHKSLSLPCLIFGSFAKQEDKKKINDIDLLVIGKLNKKERENIKSIEKKLNKKIHLINPESFKEISETLRKEVFSNHLIINNPEIFLKWLH